MRSRPRSGFVVFGIIALVALAVSGAAQEATVPSSAVLAQLPDGEAKRQLIIDCTNCHQLDPRLAYPNGASRSTAQWAATVQRMLGYAGATTPFPIMSAGRHADSTAAYLARYLTQPPRAAGAPTGSVGRAEVREFLLSEAQDLAHDVAVDSSGTVVVTGMLTHVLYTLDTASGRFTPVPIPVPSANPRAVEIDAHGDWWVLLGAPQKLARYRPHSGEWTVTDLGVYPHSIAPTADGKVWFNGHFTKQPELIGHYDPATEGVKTFEVAAHPTMARADGGPIPYELRVARDGRVWMSELQGNRVIVFTPATGASRAYTMPTPVSAPRRFDIDARGTLWIPAYAANSLVRFEPDRGSFTEFPLPTKDAVPYVARVDHATGAVWIGTNASDEVYRFDPVTRRFTIYPLPSRGAVIRHMVIDPRTHDVWLAYGGSPGIPARIARLRPAPERRAAMADTAGIIERGSFRIYKLQHPVGTERYTVRRAGEARVVDATVAFNYLGSDVALTSELRTHSSSRAPLSFRISGQTSTMTGVDVTVTLDGGAARVRRGADSSIVPVPVSAFPATAYPNLTTVQELYRYWRAQGRPPSLALLPAGVARFERRGVDTVRLSTGRVVLERYSVAGLTWGRPSLWVDATGRLIAFAGGDAELDRLEGVRDGYEAMLPLVVRRSVEDGISDLARVAREVRPRLAGRYAIVGARLVDGTGAPPVDDAVVLIEGGRIMAAGARAAVPLPKGIPVVDGRGRTLLPGLWDTHGHLEQVEWPAALLAAGVTTVRDMGNELELGVAIRDAVAAGRALGPRVLLAGAVDGGEHPLGVHTVATAAEARARVQRWASVGARQIKIYGGLPPALVSVVSEEAHRRGLTVTGHVPTGMDARQFVEAGADQFTHIGYAVPPLRTPSAEGRPATLDLASPEAQGALRFFRERGTVIEPTLARNEQHAHPRDSGWAGFEPGVSRAPAPLREVLESTGAPANIAARAMASHRRLLEVTGALHRAGVPLIAGSDLSVPGHSLHRELEKLVEAGLSPMEAIRAATAVPARVFGIDAEVGTIEAGKRADLVLVDGDPLTRIADVRRVHAVITAGRLFDPAPLWRSVGFEPGAE